MPPGLDIDLARRVLARGGLVAFPTETVYGLGGDAEQPAAVARIFAAKGRPRAHPLIVHLGAHLSTDPTLGGWAAPLSDAARELARRFWPGPLTLIARRGPRAIDEVTGGAPTVGLRVPQHPVAQALLAAFGGAVAAPSANRFGAVSPTTAAHVVADLGDAVDYVLDGGECAVGLESTIVDVSGDRPALLRPGGISREAIEAVLGLSLLTHSPTPAPGTLASHYAPRARVIAADVAALGAVAAGAPRPVAVLAPAAILAALSLPADVTAAALPDDPGAIAHDLYRALRDLDARGFATIVTWLPDDTGLNAAIADRLRRAAGPRPPADETP